jgi:16S rRNA (guanine527-N7)-methyltransferase
MPGELPDQLRAAAERLFGARLEAAERYATTLATDGLTRGLLGPREADRIWDRHLLNSAVLAELIPPSGRVVDVGAGAGLPGIPLALALPYLQVTLLEPMLRRTTFLSEVVDDLHLQDRVVVLRGRAPESAGELPFPPDCVVARAVAPLDRLVSWTMPLVPPNGVLLAVRGAAAEDEVRAAEAAISRAGGSDIAILRLGAGLVADPVTVVRVARSGAANRRKGSH